MLRGAVGQFRTYATSEAKSKTNDVFLQGLLNKVKTMAENAPKDRPQRVRPPQRSFQPHHQRAKQPERPRREVFKTFEGDSELLDSKNFTGNSARKAAPDRRGNFRKNTGFQKRSERKDWKKSAPRERQGKSQLRSAPESASRNNIEYAPENLSVSSLVRYSPRLAFSEKSRFVRACITLLQKSGMSSTGIDVGDVTVKIPAVSTSQYPVVHRSYSSVEETFANVGTLVDSEISPELAEKLIKEVVEGYIDPLTIEGTKFANDQLRLNAQVACNSLNSNYGLNVDGIKHKVYGPATGIAPVKLLLQ